MTKQPSPPIALRVDDLVLRPTVSIDRGVPLDQAARIMRAHDISSVVVGRPGDMISIVTERDLTQALADGRQPDNEVETIATPEPITVEPDASLIDAAGLMLGHCIRHLVVARGRRAVGVVSMRDVLAALVTVATPDTLLVMLDRFRVEPSELWLG